MIGDYRRHMVRRGLAESTIQRRCEALRLFEAHVGDLRRATPEDIDAFLDARHGRHGRLAKRTRYCWISHLANFYAWAVDRELVDRDPTLRVDRPRLDRLLPHPISEGDLAMALEAAGTAMRAWLVLMAYGGLRVAEVAGLTADNILPDYGAIRVLGKGSKERVVPLHPLCVEALAVAGVPRSGFVFRRPRGGRWSPAAMSREVALFFQALGMTWTAHSLRHRFGSRLLDACGNLRTVQELMGHASPATTATYTQYNIAAGRDAVLSIDTGGVTALSLPFAAAG